jgi:ABC-2 type transport system ATP-binding protein
MLYRPGLFARPRLGLADLTLKVPEKSIFGFLGPNGAGKTTAIKIMVGLQYPTSGYARILGRDASDSSVRQHIGFMPENPYFYEYLTALEAMDFYGRLCGVERSVRRRRSEELLEMFGLKSARNLRLRGFSKGMRQRLGLAQAIVHDPPVLILDEPMTGLDPFGRRDMRNIILRLRDEGHTIFFSSHILSDVEDICDQVALIRKGRLVACGVLTELLRRQVVEVETVFSDMAEKNVPESARRAARRVWHDGSLLHAIYPDEDSARAAVQDIEKAGGRMKGFIPHRESLEEYFIRTMGEESPEELPSGVVLSDRD